MNSLRGKLTQQIIDIAKLTLGVEITQEELRLLPYVQYSLMNNRELVEDRLTDSEMRTLLLWEKRGWGQFLTGRLSVTKDFNDAMNHILYLGYLKPVGRVKL